MSKFTCCNCSLSRLLFLLPLITCLLFPLTFAVCYGYAVYNQSLNGTGHFPYISEAGTKPPESCIFGQLLNIAAVVSGLTIYIRFRQLQLALDHYLPSEPVYRANKASMVLGMLASFGISVVGNFQLTNFKSMHIVGAGLAFGLGIVYCWLQVHISYKLLNLHCSRTMFYLRVVASTVTTLGGVGTVLGGIIFYQITDDLNHRLVSTISEWVMALALAVVFASFTSEFKATKVKKPEVTIFQLSKY